MNHRLTNSIVSLAAIFLATVSIAEEMPGSPFELGNAAKEESDWTAAADYFRQAIDEDPGNYKAHAEYFGATYAKAFYNVDPELDEEARLKAIKAAQEVNWKFLSELYSKWADNDPNNAIYQWKLGDLQMSKDYDKAERYFLEAIRLDPALIPPYEQLSLLEDVRGNLEGREAYLKKAVEVAPENPDVAFSYAMVTRKTRGLEEFATAVMDVTSRFPKHDRGAQALYWLATETEDNAEKIELFEELQKRYPYEDYLWASYGMSDLFAAYAKSDPEKALEIAEKMVVATEDDDSQARMAREWTGLRDFQAGMVEASRHTAAGEFAAATEILGGIKVPRGISDDPYNVAKATALAGLDSAKAAYDFLTGIVAAKPSDVGNAVLASYAAELSISPEQVRADVAKIYETNAEPLDDFSFERIDTDEMISLSDYRGKVVLVNFWYPFCGPCRGENPTIQKVLSKYQDRGFEVLALNVKPKEEYFVMPYLTGMDFDFVPLRSSIKFAEEQFQAQGFPVNILVDTQGRKISRLPPIHGDAARTFELQVEALLPEG